MALRPENGPQGKARVKKMNRRVLFNGIFWLFIGIFFLGMGFFYWNLSKKEIGKIVIKEPPMGVWEQNWSAMMQVVSEVNEFIEYFNKASAQQNRTATYVSFASFLAALASMCFGWRDSISIRGKSISRRKTLEKKERG